MMDIGAAIGFRLAVKHPDAGWAIVAQNGPLYGEDGGKARSWWSLCTVLICFTYRSGDHIHHVAGIAPHAPAGGQRCLCAR
jgi:hypothetical protein